MAADQHAPETLSVAIERIDQLITLFNKRGMDLPAGLLDRAAQFLLNGAAFETLLGRSPSDPLILMLARGPAGYRFIIKALQHAVPDAKVQRGELAWSHNGESFPIDFWLSGHLRGSQESMNAVIRVDLWLTQDGCIDKAAATVDETALARLKDARLKP